MAIQKLRQVIARSDDLDGDVAFWEAMGLSLQFRDGDQFAQLSAGDVTLALASAEESFDLEPGRWLPVFEVDSLEDALATLGENGGDSGAIRDMGSHGRTVLIHRASGSAAFFQRA